MYRASERLLETSSCSKRHQHIRDMNTMGWSTRTETAVQGSQPELRQRGRAGEVTPALCRNTEDHVWIQDIEERSCYIDVVLENPFKMTMSWPISWEKLLTGSRTAQEKESLFQTTMKIKELESWRPLWHQKWRYSRIGVCPAGFLSCFGDYH